MGYNDVIKEIGQRVKKEREKKGITQKQLVTMMQDRNDGSSIKLNSLIALETGKTENLRFSLKSLYALGDLLDVDIDFLVGRSDYEKLEHKDICPYTGLSEKAVESLHRRVEKKDGYNAFALGLICDFIEDSAFLSDCANWVKSYFDLPLQNGQGNFVIYDSNDNPLYALDLDSMKETIMIGLQNSIMRFIQRTYLDE